jgi:hypothetical protein
VSETLIGVFSGEADAHAARDALVAAGIPRECVALSADYAADGIAAEAPGEAYENQTARAGEGIAAAASTLGTTRSADTREAKRLADVERGGVVVTVGPVDAAQADAAGDVMARCKAVAIRSG